MKQIERIERMERNLERVNHALSALSEALDEYESVQEALHELDTYYGSDTWKQDLADDEQGRLPNTLKRGVLSEDAIWNVLEDYRTLKERLDCHSLQH
jgi:chromosome segregation ATPase